MTSPARCPRCDAELPAGAPQGLCPKCLLQAALDNPSAAPSIPPTLASPASPGGGFEPPSPESLAPHFPQLEILELLGRGGMGAVYKARQRGLDRLVAVKILPPDAGDPSFAERFAREARALARLNHPNIVAVFDSGRAGGHYYFIMEYVDGANLRQVLRAESLPPKEALAIVPQICEALQYAHDEGIVHRDIKPENILLDRRGRVKIADFGLAKLLAGEESDHALTGTHQVMGTLKYMAPEQLEGSRDVDHRADIYSLGVVLYELLTRELPLGRFPPPSRKVQVDVRLDEIVLRALEKEPEQRYQQASQVKTDLDAIRGLPPAAIQNLFGREYRSRAAIFGLPLVHVAFGIDPRTGRKRVAKGVLAIGDVAIGGVAVGGVAVGGLALGGASLGLVSVAGLAIGLLAAIGGLAVGGTAWGGLAVGGVALGGCSLGYYAYGGAALGQHVMSSTVQEPEAKAFFEPWAHSWTQGMVWLSVSFPVLWGAIFLFVWALFWHQERERQREAAGRDAAAAALRGRSTWLLVIGVLLMFVVVGLAAWAAVPVWMYATGPDHEAAAFAARFGLSLDALLSPLGLGLTGALLFATASAWVSWLNVAGAAAAAERPLEKGESRVAVVATARARRAGALLLAAGVCTLLAIVPVILLVEWGGRNEPGFHQRWLPVAQVSLVYSLLAGLLQIVGGRCLANHSGPGWTATGALLGLLPLSPAFVFSFPAGVWALATLGRSDVQQLYDRRREEDRQREAREANEPGLLPLLGYAAGWLVGLVARLPLMFAVPFAWLGAACVLLPWAALERLRPEGELWFMRTFRAHGHETWCGAAAGGTLFLLGLLLLITGATRGRPMWRSAMALTMALVALGLWFGVRHELRTTPVELLQMDSSNFYSTSAPAILPTTNAVHLTKDHMLFAFCAVPLVALAAWDLRCALAAAARRS